MTNYNASTGKPYITFNGTLDCRTDMWRPAIFTAKDDSTVGESISGAGVISGKYGGQVVRFSNSGQSFSISNIVVRHGQYGMTFQSGTNNQLSHARFVDCYRPIGSFSSDAYIRNILVVRADQEAFRSSGKIVGEHVTVNGAKWAVGNAGGTGTFSFTNSLFVSVTNSSTYSGANNYSDTSAALETVGAGSGYLVSGSQYRNIGTTNINPTLSADLKVRTTYPPVVLSNAIVSDISYYAEAPRDIDAPDIGFHYDPMDYVVSLSSLTNVSARLMPGVVFGTYGEYGFKIETGGKLLAEGTAEKPVRLARYDLVQEGANTNWSDTAFTSHAYFGSSSSPKPEGRFSFVEWYPAGLYANSGQSDSISFKNNIFFGGNITTVEPILRFTNCFFDRITMLYEFPQELTIQSCTFRRSLVEIFESGTNRVIRNTFFDETDVWGSSDILHSHNAYRAGFNHLTPTNVSDVFLLSAMPYANGTFGRYYQAATNLVDRGSGLASSFGLYHFTSQSSEAKEENSTVDIGFHYVAASEYGEIPKSTMTASASSTFSGWDAANAIDGEIIDPGWHNSSQTEEPAWLRIDLGTVRSIARIGYIAREVNGNPYDYSGRYKQYKYYVTTNSTTNPVNWGTPAVEGEYTWTTGQYRQDLTFEPVSGRYIYMRRMTGEGGGTPGFANVNEMWAYQPVDLGSIDTDGDGLPDYIEDSDGDGVSDTGESDWTLSNSGLTTGSDVIIFTPLK